ncbi:ALI_collapsed_G0025320.mRNA.1.CDS.1 [Saccharomyces cerevisiae]|nr:ALI_collapsed_G0025320.mRNA.1.CDS.1 [Saccharomyces cerevisiae]
MYGGAAIDILPEAQRKIDSTREQGFGNLPNLYRQDTILFFSRCNFEGVPTGFTFPIRDDQIV